MCYWMFSQRWDDMTNHFVDLHYIYSNGEKNEDKLLTVKEAADYEMKLLEATPADGTNELVSREQIEMRANEHHAEVKAMLLKRMKFHYRNSAQRDMKSFDAAVNANIREFNKVPGKND
eukprot:15360171-Ditylum_brightwellii.AAC.1